MTPHIFTYENAEKQTVYFRGYVKRYKGRVVEEIPCPDVRTNRADALKDAKKMVKTLKAKP